MSAYSFECVYKKLPCYYIYGYATICIYSYNIHIRVYVRYVGHHITTIRINLYNMNYIHNIFKRCHMIYYIILYVLYEMYDV